MQETLVQYLARQWPDADDIQVEGLAVIAGGYSRETFRFDAHVHRGGERRTYPMILRKNPPEISAILQTSRESEHQLLNALRRHTSIPVSESHFVEMESSTFGEAAMIIERVRGSGEPSLLFNGGPNADQAESVATHLCELIAELHTTSIEKLNPGGILDDPRGEGIDVSSWDRYMDTKFDYYIRSYPQMAVDALPQFYDAYLHVRRNRQRPVPLTVVHGDFNPANFLYENGRVTALIDWENAHIGDPREDLGWMALMDTLSNTNIMGSVKADGGFLQHYNKLTGFNVTPEEVGYFSMFTGAEIGIPVVSSVKRRVEKQHQEFIGMYIVQPVVVSGLTFANLLGYPMPAPGAS
jgi:aminoglycoside phosphotransferase (APT) family kinase protein